MIRLKKNNLIKEDIMKKSALIAMSGGVDSSVAAHLTKRLGTWI